MAATLFLSAEFFSLPSMDLHFPLYLPLLKATQAPRDKVTVKPPSSG